MTESIELYVTSVPPGIQAFRRLGHVMLSGALALGLVVILWSVWNLPDLVPFIPIVLLAGIGVWYLFQHPLLNLAVVLGAFVLIADFDSGFSLQEVLYGFYYLGFLAHWFFRRLILYQENIFVQREERVLILFLVLITCSFPLTLLFNGSATGFMSEWLSFSFLAFYFPIKEAVERDKRALYAIAIAVGCVGAFVLLRNVLKFQSIVSNAEYAYEVARGRAVTNESLLMVPAAVALVFAVFKTRWLERITYSVMFLLFFGGLLLTQSRGYWIAFVVGMIVLMLVIPKQQKITLSLMGLITLSGVIGIGVFLFGDAILLLLYGFVERFLSILSAGTRDISLVNRFIESVGVWHFISGNPILGYGMGVDYRVFDIIEDVTYVKTFIHNGYIALWYKFGIWGMGMVLYFFGSIVRRAFLAFRSEHAPLIYRVSGLAMLISFSGLFVSAITSNPFFQNDTIYIYGVLAGVAGGCWSHRSEKTADLDG